MTDTQPDKVAQQKVDDLLRKRREALEDTTQKHNRLFLRNILNGIFIILSLTVIIGIMVLPSSSPYFNVCIGAGILAVVIKMIEVLLRMPGFKKDSTYKYGSRNRHNN